MSYRNSLSLKPHLPMWIRLDFRSERDKSLQALIRGSYHSLSLSVSLFVSVCVCQTWTSEHIALSLASALGGRLARYIQPSRALGSLRKQKVVPLFNLWPAVCWRSGLRQLHLENGTSRSFEKLFCTVEFQWMFHCCLAEGIFKMQLSTTLETEGK